MHMHKLAFAIALTIASFAATYAFAETRLALSIGVSNYDYLPDLERSGRDAEDVASLLRSYGYKVQTISGLDGTAAGALKFPDQVTKTQIEAGFNQLVSSIKDAKKGGAVSVVVYYSGHGFEAYGNNWLVGGDLFPQGKKISGEKLFKKFGVSVNQQLAKLHTAGADETIVILDACREAKIEVADRRYVSPGLDIAGSVVPQSFFLVLAAARESYAYAGLPNDSGDAKRNSVFTRYFLDTAKNTTTELSSMSNIVALNVYNATKSMDPRQMPAVYDQIPGASYLNPEDARPNIEIAAPPKPKNEPPVSIYFRPERLRDAQSLAKIFKLGGTNYALVPDDLETVKQKQPPGTTRIVRLDKMSRPEEERYKEIESDVEILSKAPVITRVKDNQLINKPFQIQLF